MRKGKARVIRLPKLEKGRSAQDQLKGHLRQLILTGGIGAGARMPAQRILARDTGLSRNTVTIVYETLISEGLLETRHGSGTFVVKQPFRVAAQRRVTPPKDPVPELPLHQGVPDLSLFPREIWRRLQDRRWRELSVTSLGYGDAAGWSGLRHIMAQRLAATRGLSCTAEQVFIVPSAMHGIRLVCRALGARGKSAWVEDPTYPRVREILQENGVTPARVPVDSSGVVVSEGVRTARDAVFAYVTPAAQFPTGAPMAWPRRQALLNWAQAAGGWIVEDDYDADFVFEGVAPPALASEATGGRVIYVASHNNVFFPALQLACVVAPDGLVDAFARAANELNLALNGPMQMVAHDFMEGGHLAAHLRRCREAYAERRALLRSLLAERINLELAPQPVGLHVAGWFREPVDEQAVHRAISAEGVIVHPIVDERPGARPGLYAGFSGYSCKTITSAVDRMARAVQRATPYYGQEAG
ncbi:MAG: PLP-dependent aminotransferase family protein [Hyphomonadaceae bacterium]